MVPCRLVGPSPARQPVLHRPRRPTCKTLAVGPLALPLLCHSLSLPSHGVECVSVCVFV